MSAARRPLTARLTRRLTLEEPVASPEGDILWQPVATLWAGLEPVGADERAAADHLEGVATHRIALRFRTDLTSRHRLALGQRRFRILAVFDPDERRRSLVCLAEEGGR